jgi:CSLREA domain-containing protein
MGWSRGEKEMSKNNGTFYLDLGTFSRLVLTVLLTTLFVGLRPVRTTHADTTFIVTSLTDEYTANATCSLREAITNANNDANTFPECGGAGTGHDTIILTAGSTYQLSLTGGGEDANATGDLDILDTDGLTIQTDTAGGRATIDANDIDRVINLPDAGGDLTLIDIIVQDGTATAADTDDGGGGILVKRGSLTLTRVTIRDNVVTGNTGADGGGLQVDYDDVATFGTITIVDSTISNNTSIDYAGGAWFDANDAGTLFVNITGSTISGNQLSAASNDGGGIMLQCTSTAIVDFNMTNSTVSGNTATDDGGGICWTSTDCDVDISYSTIANNTASGDGGGIYAPTTGTLLDMFASILADNTATSGVGPDCRGAITSSAGHNLVENTTDCTLGGTTTGNVTGTDPNLAALAYNGGGTQTQALNAGSAAIDQISSGTANCGTSTTTDQRGAGFTRPTHGGTSNNCDTGAYERAVGYTLTVNGAGTGNGTVQETAPWDIMDCTSTAGTTSGTCTYTYGSGVNVVLVANATLGSFTSWTNCDSPSGNQCTQTLGGNETVTARFDQLLPEPSNHPTNFSATANSASQITTAWTDSTGGTLPDGYLVLCNLTGTFSDPVDGTPQSDDANCADGSGAMNVAHGTGTSPWTGLNSDTQYYYKIFPYTNSGATIDYKTDGTPPTDDATTPKVEPSNHPTGFSATADSVSQITTAWTDSSGGTLPDGYLVLCNLTGTFSDPVDGTAQSDDANCTDGSGAMNVSHGTGTYSWTGLDSDTQYYYVIFPYTNSGANIDYKTDGTPPTDDATTPTDEPTNHPTGFSATADSASQITTAWTDSSGGTLPDGYLVLCNLTGTFSGPVDGTPQSDDADCSDGNGAMNVTQGTGTYSWTGLDSNTQYYFTIFPYTNSGTSIDYKTDGTPPTDDATTLAPDLQVSKSNDVAGAITLGGDWEWRLVTTNSGSASADFDSGQTLLSDQLPTTDISYGAVTVDNQTGVSGSISCSVNGSGLLVCSASGGAVSIGASTGAFRARFAVTPTVTGVFTNPTGGSCSVDPNDNVAESDETDNACNSDSVTVNQASTTITITSDAPDPSVVGQSYTVSATVTSGGGTPTGSVDVDDGEGNTCTITLAGGAGHCSLASTSAGAKTLTADYDGDANFGASSDTEPHTVNAADTTATITSDDPDPSVVEQALTVVYSVTVTAPGSGTPTGNVTVGDGVDSCVGTVAAGRCDITLSTTGARTLTASYAGDGDYNASVSPGEPHDVSDVGILISPVSLNISEPDGSDVFSATLTDAPTDDVTFALTLSNGQCDVTPSSVTLNSGNWDSGVEVTVNAVDDEVADGDRVCVVQTGSASSSDGNYDGLDPANVSVTVQDDDTAGVTLIESGGSTAVAEGGAGDSFVVVLTSEPTADVTLSVDPDGQLDLGAGGDNPVDLTFTALDWSAPQTITVSAVDDAVVEGPHTGVITHSASSGDGDYDGISIPGVTVNITDNDGPGVTITESGGSTDVAEGGTGDGYEVVLNTQPSAAVTLTISPDTQVALTPTLMRFTPGDWDAPQTVIVAAIDDDVVEGPHTGTITHSASSPDSNYDGISILDVSVNITDNDVSPGEPGVTITESGGSTDVAEGGATDSFEVVLDTQPSAAVTITISPDAQAVVTPITLVFTPDDWDMAQTVTVAAVDDEVVEGTHTGTISHSASSNDGNYDGISILDVTVHITDNDVQEVVFYLPLVVNTTPQGLDLTVGDLYYAPEPWSRISWPLAGSRRFTRKWTRTTSPATTARSTILNMTFVVTTFPGTARQGR